jgi:hypothetical protein
MPTFDNFSAVPTPENLTTAKNFILTQTLPALFKENSTNSTTTTMAYTSVLVSTTMAQPLVQEKASTKKDTKTPRIRKPAESPSESKTGTRKKTTFPRFTLPSVRQVMNASAAEKKNSSYPWPSVEYYSPKPRINDSDENSGSPKSGFPTPYEIIQTVAAVFTAVGTPFRLVPCGFVI